MAKVKINKLPEGYKIRNGKVVKTMKSGGYITGDQMRDGSYGLVTIPSQVAEGTEIGPTPTPDVRYSLAPVPRDEANIEAEKGETVLTDLDEDGNFELYNIEGKRHSKGGTPLNLPPQSFVFSDTAKLRFNTNELAEFGIESKKKMTPAAISKKYQLNPYIGVLANPNTDIIGETSAELMLDKNKMSLSQLAFAQENKKKWRDGVPLASHPYIASQGEDPIEFSMEVEELKRKEAEDAAIAQLPPDLQQKALMMRAFMEQAQQQPQPQMSAQGPPAPQMPQQMPPQGMMPPQQMQQQMPPQQMMARYGGQLPKAQKGIPKVSFEDWRGEWLDSEEAQMMVKDLIMQGLDKNMINEQIMAAARSAYDVATRTHGYGDGLPYARTEFDTPIQNEEQEMAISPFYRDMLYYDQDFKNIDTRTELTGEQLAEAYPELNIQTGPSPTDPYNISDYTHVPTQPTGISPSAQTQSVSPPPSGTTGTYNSELDKLFSTATNASAYNDYFQNNPNVKAADVNQYASENFGVDLGLTDHDLNFAGTFDFSITNPDFLSVALGANPNLKNRKAYHEAEAKTHSMPNVSPANRITGQTGSSGAGTTGTANATANAVTKQQNQGASPSQAVANVAAQTGQTEEEVRREVAFSIQGLERTAADPAANISDKDPNKRAFAKANLTKEEYNDLKNKIKTYEGLQAEFKEKYKNRGAKDHAGLTSPEYDAALQDVIETAKKYGADLEGVDLSGVVEDPSGTKGSKGTYFGKRHDALAFNLGEETFVDDKPIAEVEGERETIIEDPDYEVPARGDVPEWWAQDVNNYVGAVDDLWSIKERYPWMPQFQTPQAAPIYRDPTREIAAIGEQAGIAANVASTYAGPQRAAALAAKTQGLAGKQVADALSNIQGGNVEIYNQADQFNKQMDAQGQRINNKYDIDLYDRTMLTMQNADDARRAARHNVRQQWNQGTTNMWQTEALEDLYPQFNIDQGIGGNTVFTNPRDIVAEDDPKTMEEQYFDFLQRRGRYFETGEDANAAWNTIYGKPGRRNKRDQLASAVNSAYPAYGAQYQGPNDYYNGG